MNFPDTPDPPPAPAADEPAPPQTGRWVVRRKADIVAAVRDGALSLEEACARYNLSIEEFLSWQRALSAHGVPGLRATRFQIYRDTDARRGK